MNLFMPSCNNPIAYRGSLMKAVRYLEENGYVDGLYDSCCKPSSPLHAPLPHDTHLVTVCNSCTAVAKEHLGARSVITLFEVINNDERFAFPDYGGETIALQDCWRTRGNHELHLAIRELMKKMNFELVELTPHADDSRFCGLSTYHELTDEIRSLAPSQFGDNPEGMFIEQGDEIARDAMRDHVKGIGTMRVASYCFSCDQGLSVGGADSVSLLNLLFDDVQPLLRSS